MRGGRPSIVGCRNMSRLLHRGIGRLILLENQPGILAPSGINLQSVNSGILRDYTGEM